MKIIFACGGTAGHINPAIAIANKILENKDNEVLFIGTQKGMEAKRVPESGYNIEFINIAGLNRKNILKNVTLTKKILNSIKQSKLIINDFKPDFVIGTGGYVTLPVIYSAHKLGIKTLIHEVNSVAGLSTNFLSKYADIITCAFENTKIKTSKTIHHVGNPIRSELLSTTRHSGLDTESKSLIREKFNLDERPIILVFGGSLGAKALNDAMEKLVLKNSNKYQIIWATGERYYDEIVGNSVFSSSLSGITILPYIHNLDELLPLADITITRAGGTIFELLALGKASIIIPSPNVTANHQVKNAKSFAKKGAINMLLESDIDLLPQTIESTLNSQKTLENNALKYAKPHATDEIIKLISL